MTTTGELRIPRPTSATQTRWIAATGVAVLGMAAYVAVTDPGNRWAVFTLLPLLVLLLAVVGQFAVWIDADRGVLRWHRRIVRRVEVELSEATDIALVNSGGTVMLRVRAGNRGGYAPMLVLSEYTKSSQAPELLRTIADALERHARPKVHGSVPAELRAQAKFMAAGGLAENSPLAARSKNGLRRAAGAAGAAGGVTDLLP